MRFTSLFSGKRKNISAFQKALREDSSSLATSFSRLPKKHSNSESRHRAINRTAVFEHMEARAMFNVDPIWVGGVYIEDDTGSDLHGDTFYVTFKGGATGTTLNRLIIDGDQGAPGFNVGDNFFDTLESGLGADHAFPFQITRLTAADPSARVIARVEDGSTRMVLEFQNFRAGDVLVFTIDVDEVEFFDPNERNLEEINSGFDPITSGVEFQTTKFQAFFSAPHFEDIDGITQYLNRYDAVLAGSNLQLPADDAGGLRDRSAGAAFTVTQIAKPITIAGTVFVDNNLNLIRDNNEQPLPGVSLELFRKQGSQFVSTGHRTTTNASGNYEFGLNLKLEPGIYEVRETQPTGYYSVGAIPGVLNGSRVGSTVVGNADVLTQIEVLLGDTHATQLNFAEAQPTTIRGFVYSDINDDGVRGATEIGIEGVEIRLQSISTVNGTITRTTRTATDGSYSFTNLPPGRYKVTEVNQPAGYFDGKDTAGTVGGQRRGQVTVNEVIDLIQLNGNENGIEFNFGELPPSSLSGFVHIVNPGFDCDSTDPGAHSPLAGVTVLLLDSSSRVIETKTTNAQGYYSFDNLPVGVYTIREITPAGVIDGDAMVGRIDGVAVGRENGTSEIDRINVRPGQTGVQYNFCELPPAEISGHVFEDVNDDGIRQSSEPLLAGVQIDLYDAAGNKVDSIATDQNGFYSFRFLSPGVYRLHETTPAAYLDGKDIVGTIDGRPVGQVNSATDTISQINLPSGKTGLNYDFGEVRPASISGHVIVDINDNNRVDLTNERPLGGVVVQLLDQAGNVIKTTTTNVSGEYLFTDIRPGRYSVHELQPDGFFNGRTYPGSAGGDASELDFIRGFQIDSGANLTNYDFTEIPPAQIAGYVFIDNNGDCLVQPGERGISNVRVDLISETGVVLQTARTNADGSYQFSGLAPGRYAVRETQPEGYFQGGQRAGSGGGDATQPDIITAININGGDVLVEYNFCELLPAGLGGTIYADLDQDCIQDPNEQGIVGVRVELLDQSGRVITFTTTDRQGNYRFENLQPGKYSIREIQPSGYFNGGQTAPAGRATTTIDDLLANIDLMGGEFLDDLDFCEVPPATISGYVFQDGPTIVNETGTVPDVLRPIRDGQRDASDTPLANVVLELRSVNGQPFPSSRALSGIYSEDVIRVKTDANGYFEFTGLRAGAYHVYQIQPEGYVDGLDTPGSSGGLSLNAEDLSNDPEAAGLLAFLALDEATNPRNDAILLINIAAGDFSRENNFSEVLARRDNPIPPIDRPPAPLPPARDLPQLYPQPSIVIPPPAPPIYIPDLLIAGLASADYTWHLSIINAGTPRGSQSGKLVNKAQLADVANVLDIYHWKIARMQNAEWRFVSSDRNDTRLVSKNAFDIEDAIPLAGDFNGDGVDELALYLEGEWLIDVNGNGRWDDGDMWAKLGDEKDLPVIGDWDGDGKDDIGIFGPQWEGDDEALANEVGLPDSENFNRRKPKNIPQDELYAEERRRLLQRSTNAPARSDVIDHVFREGVRDDQPISGDFNGDGISTVGLFRNGIWRLDSNGDGKWNEKFDSQFEFGKAGDIPVVGDFDGDGLDDIGVIRHGKLIVDSNRNGREDATDRVFQLESESGEYVIGDFDGDGIDEAALHRDRISGTAAKIATSKPSVDSSQR